MQIDLTRPSLTLETTPRRLRAHCTRARAEDLYSLLLTMRIDSSRGQMHVCLYLWGPMGRAEWRRCTARVRVCSRRSGGNSERASDSGHSTQPACSRRLAEHNYASLYRNTRTLKKSYEKKKKNEKKKAVSGQSCSLNLPSERP